MVRIYYWIFGSFFRTLGRFLVYIFIAFLVFYFLKDTKLPKFKLTDLLYMNVSAETFTNNSYMSWQLNKNNSMLNSGNNPFYTSVDNLTDYGNYDLYLFYNNYTAYNNYFYDISLTIYYDSPFIFANRVNNCNIYVEGSSNQTSDGCRVVDFTNTSLTIANYNIQTLTGTGHFTSQFIFPVPQNNEITVFQVNSFKLDIIAKEDKSITSETFGNAINNVIDSQNNNTNNIINNQNSNTQDIIDNQNANSQAEIDSQKVCNFIDKNSIVNDNKILVDSGVVNNNNDYGITDYISINSNTKIKVSSTGVFSSVNNSALCFYNVNKGMISCIKNNTLTLNSELSIPSNTSYVRFTIRKNDNQPQYEICQSGNQAITNSLNDINSSLTDDSPPTNLDSLNDSAGWLPPGPVDSILNLPLSFLTNLNTNLSKSCQPVNLPLPFVNKNLPLPCVNSLYNEITGLPNWINIIGTIASAFILFGYFINLYKYVDDTLTFRENNYIDNWSGV